MSPAVRQVEVAPERIARWVAGCAVRHGTLTWSWPQPGTLRLSAPDGLVADLHPLVTRAEVARDAPDLERWVVADAVVALLLVRRGGYAVGRAEGPALVTHKVGTRYVQSRTAAGGWSQQRFARRRGNQADALVAAVQDHAARLLTGPGTGGAPATRPEALVVGGDRTLVRGTLDDPRLRALVDLPRASLYDLPDPGLDVLRRALTRGRSVRVTLTDPP